MAETEAWINRELPAMGTNYRVTIRERSRMGEKHEIESAVLSDCRLTLRTTSQRGEDVPRKRFIPTVTSHNTISVTMKDLDVSRLLPELFIETGSGFERIYNMVQMNAIRDRGEPFTHFDTPTRSTEIRLRDQDAAVRVAEVFRRAAVLCGATSQPVEAGPAQRAQKMPNPPSKPPSPGPSKMTNDVVIQLVSAGLSEQVVTTSIRHAPRNDFDLTTTGLIALKKAGVSDGVILVMQERAQPVKAAIASVVEAPPEPIQPPPPPPDQPPPSPKSISKGDTREQVVEALGQPERIAKLDSKEILYYKDFKVTLVNGKVTDVQ
jgi:hypothetical protein